MGRRNDKGQITAGKGGPAGARRKQRRRVTLDVQDGTEDRPCGPPTDAPPGSEEKIQEIMARVRRRQSTDSPGDRALDMSTLGLCRAGNNALIKTGEVAENVVVTTVTDFGGRLSTFR